MRHPSLFRTLIAFLLTYVAATAQADDPVSGTLELKAGMIEHQSRKLDVSLQRLLVVPDVALRFIPPRPLFLRRAFVLHVAPIVGVTRATVTLRESVSRTVSTKKLKGKITEATEESPRELHVSTRGVNAPPGLLPPIIAFPLGDPGDPGADIPDEIELDVPFSAEVDVPWTPTIGFRIGLDVAPDSRFWFEPYAEYVHSLGPGRATLRSAAVDAGGLGIDVGFLRTSVTMTHRWSLLHGGARLGYRFDRVRAYADVGAMRIVDSYDIRLSGAVERELQESGITARERRSIRQTEPFYVLGAEIDLDERDRFSLRTEGIVAATPRSATSFLTLGLRIRLDD